MVLTVYWTEFAESQLDSIFNHYFYGISPEMALNIVEGVISDADKLSTNPELGKIETLLEDRKELHRSLISKNYKIIYWINISKSRIDIVDIFDTRQEPIKINKTNINDF
jgi:plasmid stabilization system protein ParE